MDIVTLPPMLLDISFWVSLFFIGSIVIYLVANPKIKNFKFLWLVALASGALLLFYKISDNYTGIGITPATWYELKNTYGLTWGLIWPVIYIVVLFSLPVLVLFFYSLRKRKKLPKSNKSIPLLPIILIFLFNPAIMQLSVMGLLVLKKSSYKAELNEKAIPVAIESIKLTKKPKSVVYIYAESLELSFLTQNTFQNLTPNLKKLREESLSFENILQAPFTDWTIAGVVSSQCGFPALGNNKPETNDFITKDIICLSDILESHSYNTVFMKGFDIAFSGTDKFLSSHNYDSFYGFKQINQNRINNNLDPLPITKWGLKDDIFFENVLSEYHSLLKNDNPFFLALTSVDTHTPSGGLSDSCLNLKDNEFFKNKSEILQAVHCSDYLIYKLVKDIQKLSQDYNHDVLIIVASDHLMPLNHKAFDILNVNDSDRKNLFFAINKSILPARIIKQGTTFDYAPTILHLMGFESSSFYLGRNLLLSKPTLIEEFGETPFFARLLSSFITDNGSWSLNLEKKENENDPHRD